MGDVMTEFASKYETLLLRRERSRLHVTLNRPQVKNALNPTLIGELRTVFQNLRDRRDIKVVILRGAGGTFCAGADLKNMEQSITEKRLGERDPIALNNREYGTFLEMVNTTPQVVVAAVEGYAIAGGFGLLCVSDVAICTEDAGFAMSETAIGIVPAQIAPFVAARIGVPQTRHLALTAARFKGPEALRLGIAHHLVKDSAALDAKLEEILKQIDRCAPLGQCADQGRGDEGGQRAALLRARFRRRPVRRGAAQPRSRRRPARLRREEAAEMGDRMIAVSALDLPARQGTDYPAPHDAPCRNRIRRALGDVFGLSQFGVNMLDLAPGTWSSQRHWHEQPGRVRLRARGRGRAGDRRGRDDAAAGHGRRLPRRHGQRPSPRQSLGQDRARARGRHAHDRRGRVLFRHRHDGAAKMPTARGYFTKDGRPLK